MALDTKYTPLFADGDDEETQQASSPGDRPPRKRCLGTNSRYTLAVILGALIGVTITVAVGQLRHMNWPRSGNIHSKTAYPWHDNSKFLDDHFALSDDHTIGEEVCGRTWQEAKARGCRFDVLAGRWYSEECASFDVLDTMLEEVHFEWYSDEHHTVPMSQEVAYAGEYEWAYPLHDYHILHCLYLFRRFHIAVLEHRIVDADLLSYGHTLHCTRLIMQWPLEWKYGKNTTTKSPSRPPACLGEPL